MLAAYTELKNAQKVKQFISKNNLFDVNYQPLKELDHIYFPLCKKMKIPSAKIVNTKFTFKRKDTPVTIEDLLKGKLTKKELENFPRSQEVVGEIMILEVPKELSSKERLIAEAYLKQNKKISTVVKKTKIHSGVFRTRKVKIIAGKKTKETIHFENGVKIKLHLEKTYFSARSGNERLRLAKLVKKNEEVLVMFSGAGPFPLVIGKKSPLKMVYGIELNPLAHQYAVENVMLNRLDDKIKIFNGDVRKIIPKMRKKFDRIAMPLPKTGEDFLNIALSKSKIGTTIHLYSFLDEKDLAKESIRIKKICVRFGHKVRVLRKVKCGQFSPNVYRMCFDLKVLS